MGRDHTSRERNSGENYRNATIWHILTHNNLTKHFEVESNFILDMLVNHLISLLYISTLKKMVDIITKGLRGKCYDIL